MRAASRGKPLRLQIAKPRLVKRGVGSPRVFFGVGASLLALRPRRARLVFGCRARLACALVASFTNKIGVLYHLRGKPLGDAARARASRTPSKYKTAILYENSLRKSATLARLARGIRESAREEKRNYFFCASRIIALHSKKAQAHFFRFARF